MDRPPDITAADRLRAAADVLELQNEPGVREVADGIRCYLRGGAASLDEALELIPDAGQRRPSTMARLGERDALLRRAAGEFFPGNTSHQARKLHIAISRYAVSSWPRERNLATCLAAPAPVMPPSLTQAEPSSADKKLPIGPDDRRRELQRRRARRHRRRERDGLQHLAIDVPYAVVDLLITERYLTETDAADRHAIERALEIYLVDQIR